MKFSSEPFVAAVVILQESAKLLRKNENLMALTVIPTILFSSIFFFVTFSCTTFSNDVLLNQSLMPLTSTNRPDFLTILAGFKQDFHLIRQVINTILVLAYCTTSLFSIIATILVSAISYTETTKLRPRDFISLVLRSWKRASITAFYGTISRDLGYIYLITSSANLKVLFSGPVALVTTYFICNFIYNICYLYTSILWALSVTMSVIEENCCGFEAVKKAGELGKGKWVQGCILNTIFAVISVVLFQGFWIVSMHNWVVNYTIFWLVLVNLSCLLRMFIVVVFTVFYFECKETHGEEISLKY